MTYGCVNAFFAEVMINNNWKKISIPYATCGKTAFPGPQQEALQGKYGLRLDFAQELTRNGIVYNIFTMHANENSGSVPSPLDNWRDTYNTHAVMAIVLVKKGATMDEVEAALIKAEQEINNSSRICRLRQL